MFFVRQLCCTKTKIVSAHLATIMLMNILTSRRKLLLLILPVILIAVVGVFMATRQSGSKDNGYSVDAPDNPELTNLTTPYFSIADISVVGPYSSNQELSGYIHNGIDFMSERDLVEYRSISDGVVAEAKVFYDSSRTDTHPQVNLIVLYNETTKIVYSFEPYSKNIADAERQLTLMNVKEGDTITAGQSLGKLIKTAPQSHVHIHIMKNEKEFCFESLFTESDVAEMMTKVVTAPNKPKQFCY